MKVEQTPLNAVFILIPDVHKDQRGFLMESYRKDVFRRELGINPEFVQDIHSRSAKNVIRGLQVIINRPWPSTTR